MDLATIGDFWDCLLLTGDENGFLAGVNERPNLVKQVLNKYVREPIDYNEDKAERRIFLWEEGTRKLQVLDSGLKEAAEVMLLNQIKKDSDSGFEASESDALHFLKQLLSGDPTQTTIAVHAFACCSVVSSRLTRHHSSKAPVLGPILAIKELNGK